MLIMLLAVFIALHPDLLVGLAAIFVLASMFWGFVLAVVQIVVAAWRD
jgi:hypothetical protein